MNAYGLRIVTITTATTAKREIIVVVTRNDCETFCLTSTSSRVSISISGLFGIRARMVQSDFSYSFVKLLGHCHLKQYRLKAVDPHFPTERNSNLCPIDHIAVGVHQDLDQVRYPR